MPRFSSLLFTSALLAGCNGDKGFVTYNTAPAVTILEPLEGEIFEFGEPVNFLGQVVDDGEVTSLDVDWASSIDGVLPDPESPDPDGRVDFVSSILGQGIHVITLRATDSANEQGEATVQIEVMEQVVVPDVPTITVVSPQSGQTAVGGQDFVFAANANDEIDPPSSLVITLTSNPGGQICVMVPDGGGNASCAASLDLGNYLLTFTVEDSDGFTAQANAVLDVIDPLDFDADGDGWTPNGGDCNDAAIQIYPGAPEVCDGIDNDCDPNTAIDVNSPCYDDDGDGFCEVPPCTNATETLPDCNDAAIDVSPAGIEIMNLIDDDCDGLIDEGFGNYDDDGDGFCETPPCTNLPGSLPGDPQDCDDTNGAVNPAVPEVCNDGVDNNCDTLENELDAVGCLNYYRDQDQDGYGDPTSLACYCAPTVPFTADNPTDCNDTIAIVNPGQTGWFSAATNGSFDYNCDGSATQRYTTTSAGCAVSGLGCNGTDGWIGGAPACGDPGQYQEDCSLDIGALLLGCGLGCGGQCLFGATQDCLNCLVSVCPASQVCDIDYGPSVQECH